MQFHKRKTWIAIVIMSLISLSGVAQAETRIEASGSGFIDVVPDQVNFRATVTEVNRNARTAQDRVNETMAAMENGIAKFNLDEESVDSSALSLNHEYQWDANSRKQVFVGYRVTRNLTFTAKKISDIGAIMNTLTTSGATQISSPQLSYSQPEKAKEQALRNAVARAMAVVEVISSSANMAVKEIESISEENGYSALPLERVMRAEPASLSDSAPEVSVGTLRYSAEVRIVAKAG